MRFTETEGVLRFAVPLPFRPSSVNAFLVRLDAGGWMLVDGGIDSDEAWQSLHRSVTEAAGWSALRCHVVTHMHLDHIGLVPRVRDASSVPLAMGVLDAERAAHAAAEPDEERTHRAELFRSHGMPEEILRRAVADAGPERRESAFVPPDELLPCGTLRLAFAPEWVSVWTPGHTAGHTALFRARDGVLIAGDAVIPRVSPTIGVNRQREDPVRDYLETLDTIERLNPRVVLGGHGEPMYGLERVAELRRELLDEIERVRRLLSPEPATAWELSGHRYHDRELPMPLRILALRETIAHLQRLVGHGEAVRFSAAGVIHFASASGAGDDDRSERHAVTTGDDA